MKLIGPYTYHLDISDRKITVRGHDGSSHFTAPATSKRTPKLYVTAHKGMILYIGVTNQPLSVRLRGGMTANGTHGYYGYSWGKKNHSIQLDLWRLAGSTEPMHDLETIEAETVFLFRQQSGQWPSEQTEIHFHQSNDGHRKCAAQILDSLKEK